MCLYAQKQVVVQSTPFHVRFGKAKLLRSREKIVTVTVNWQETDLKLTLGSAGEAYFILEDHRSDEEIAAYRLNRQRLQREDPYYVDYDDAVCIHTHTCCLCMHTLVVMHAHTFVCMHARTFVCMHRKYSRIRRSCKGTKNSRLC